MVCLSQQWVNRAIAPHAIRQQRAGSGHVAFAWAELAEAVPPPALETGKPPGSCRGWRNAIGHFAGYGRALPPAGLYDRVLQHVERPLLMAALAATRGNQIRAAALLGVNRNTLAQEDPRPRHPGLPHPRGVEVGPCGSDLMHPSWGPGREGSGAVQERRAPVSPTSPSCSRAWSCTPRRAAAGSRQCGRRRAKADPIPRLGAQSAASQTPTRGQRAA